MKKAKILTPAQFHTYKASETDKFDSNDVEKLALKEKLDARFGQQ